jgi:DNA-binding NarL/FixJ family response regulator
MRGEVGTRERVLWCVLCAVVLGGPYGLDAANGTAAVSPTYAFTCAGMLAGMWVTLYPSASSLVRSPKLWKACVCAGLLTVALAAVPNLLALCDACGWAPALWWAVNAAAPFEKPLACAAAFVCGATSARFGTGCPDARLSPRSGALRCCAVLGAFAVGLLRPAAWGALLAVPAGVLVLWAGLCGWALCLARRGGPRGCVAALCLGELAWRAASRFGLAAPLVGSPFQGVALLAAAVCLAGGALALARLGAHDVSAGEAPCTPERPAEATSALEPWERERLAAAGLTARELDVLAASVDGCDSAEAARRLGVQPSTVRTYKGRICKKLGVETFDRVLGERSARLGLFGPADGEESVPVGQPALAAEKPAPAARARGRLAAAAPFARLTGCLALLLVLLMPFGTLPAFWDATWVLSYGVVAGVLASCVPACLRRAGLLGGPCRAAGPFVSLAFLACAGVCCAVRRWMELQATGLTLMYQVTLFGLTAGLVCFGLLEVRACVGSPRMSPATIGASCACTAVLELVPLVLCDGWWGVSAFALLVCAAGSLLELIAQARPGRSPRKLDAASATCPDNHPAVLASWCAVAFVWEECWRGIVYTSLADLGIPCLAVLVLRDAFVLVRQEGTARRVACGIVLACAALLCVAKGAVFCLLVGTVLLELQTVCSCQNSAADANRASWPPALLGVVAGCCAAVYVSNTRGSYILRHAGSILPSTLDWFALSCFALLLAAALGRVAHAVCRAADPGCPNVGRERLEGCLVGKGLTPTETAVCVALARGASVPQVAEELAYSVSAVGAAKRAAFAKLGVTTRAQYMAFLYKEFNLN